jgi:small-conductance mechanosensitive channel
MTNDGVVNTPEDVMPLSLPSRLRRLVRAVLLAVAACALAAGRGLPADPPADDKAKPVETKPVEFHRLTNDDLLKRAQGIHDKAVNDYRAAARALAAAEVLLEETDVPAEAKSPDPVKKAPTAEDKAEAAVAAGRGKQEAAGRKLKRVQARKELLDRVSAGLEGCQLAGVALLNALDDLRPYVIEIGLRVKDGSLAADKVPPALAPDALDKKRKELADDQRRRKQQAADAPQAQAAVARQLEEANRTVLAAAAEVAQAGKALAQEQKRREMEKTHARKGPDEMLADLAQLVEEGDGLRGSYELALVRFNARLAEVDRLRKALDVKQPEVKLPQITRAEDVEVAARSLQELVAFFAARVKAIEALRAALAVLVKQGGEFEADDAVSSEHLFKMSVVAGLLRKAGVAEEKFPDGGQPKRVAEAAERQARSAAQVQAATEKARAELAALPKQLAETRDAGEAAGRQLANLKESQAATTAALKWAHQLKGMTAAQVAEAFGKTRHELAASLEKLASDQAGYRQAVAAVAESRARLDGLKDPFLRRAEEEGQAERLKIAGELRKEAGLDRAAPEAAPTAPAEPKKAEETRKAGPEKKPEPDRRTELEKTTESLAGLQQLLAARDRVQAEREDRTRDLLAALDELEKKGTACNATLAEARQLALRLTAAGSDLKKRVGKGELAGDRIPDGVTDALRGELRTRLDADAAGVLTTLAQVGQEREKLRRPDADADALRTATGELLALVGQRLDLLADLKKLTAEFQRDRKDRPRSEVKRLDQRAADRQSADRTAADRLLGIDGSKAARSLEELLETCYQELIEIEDRDENLKRQKEKVEQLVELTRKESAAVAKTLPLLEKQAARIAAAREEELVLARARLRPDQADELLQAYQTKTGRLLARPVPVGAKEKAEKVAEMAGVLFERQVQGEAVKRWQEVLAVRLAPTGLKAEAGLYQDELARVNATAAANARRVAALTGTDPAEGQPAEGTRPVGGEIGATRQELTRVRTWGVQLIGIKIAAILLAAFLLPRVLLWVLRRAIGGGGPDSGLMLSALRVFLKVGVWVTALALILSVLGFDVTAIVAGLGIGGLAVGLAAQTMIADVIAALVIVAERRFRIGDVIKLGGDDPAKVIGLSWRSTQLRNADGLTVNIPNRKVTEQSIQNLTRGGRTFDSLDVTVTTQREESKVRAVIRQTLAECRDLTADQGVTVKEFSHKGETKVVKYRFWWFVEDYESRNRTRDEVFTRISGSLGAEDLKGTEVTLA